MINNSPRRTTPPATPPATPPLAEERSQAAVAVVCALRGAGIAEQHENRGKAIGFVLALPGWRIIKDRLAAAGYERSAVIRWATSANGGLPGDATPGEVQDVLEQAVRSAPSPGEWVRRHD